MKVDTFCSECDEAPVCAICIDCKKCYCNDCCEKHIEKDPDHRLCQTQNVTTSFKKTLCGNCTKIAARFCKICNELRCLSCFHYHEEKYMLRIFPVPVVSKTRNTEDGKTILTHIKTVSIQNDQCTVRINGIGYLQDGTLVALDGGNHELIVVIHNKTHKEEQKTLKEAFTDEPRAMTTMEGNKIAVTFPYKKRITIYDIMLNETTILNFQQDITMEQLNVPKCKPFSIAYHQGWFALEVGEGEDGKIIIFDHSGITIKTLEPISYKFAYFTGHTIQLALDTNQCILVVSAMGKRIVSCMDYSKRDYLWKISKASPRSMLIHEKNIILSSRRCNAIYQLDKKSGRKIILAKDILSPRYIAYHSYARELCIHVKNGTGKDELAFYDFKVPNESNAMSKLLDHEGQ